MTGNDLEEMLGSLTEEQRRAIELGDTDATMELFAKELSEGEQEEETAPAPENADDKQKPAESQSAEGAPSAAEGEEPFVEAKDGKNRIPYSALQEARDKAKRATDAFEALKKEADLTKGEKSELEKLLDQQSRKVKLLESQLTSDGKEPDKLPEEIELTDELLESLKDYGEAGKAMIAMAHKLRSATPATAQPQQPAINTDTSKTAPDQEDIDALVETAIQGNADLAKWRDSDPEKWEEAKKIDEVLRRLPEHENQSFEERFAKVAEMTRLKFGITAEPSPSADTARQKAQQKIAAASELASAPKSLSNFGKADNSSDKDLKTRIDSMSEDELLKMGETLSLDQFEKLLAEIDL